MSAIYCPNCGNKNEYTLARPNFCGKCGSSFGIKSNSNSKIDASPTYIPEPPKVRCEPTRSYVGSREVSPLGRSKRRLRVANDDEYCDENATYTGIPNISKLDVEILLDPAPTYEKLGDVLGSTPTTKPIPRRVVKMTKEEMDQKLQAFTKKIWKTERFDTEENE